MTERAKYAWTHYLFQELESLTNSGSVIMVLLTDSLSFDTQFTDPNMLVFQ